MSGHVSLSSEVAGAIDAGRPVVALETSVLAQGLPPPQDLECAARMEEAVREAGAVPAWTAVLGGEVRVGLGDGDVERLARGQPMKVARRDLAVAVAEEADGATTVSATLWAADQAGVAVAATGGIGGVHPSSGDVSADLEALATTNVLLVCAGPKSIVDPGATLERLDSLGVTVLGYRSDRLPFFVVRDAGIALEHRVDEPVLAARVLRSSRQLGLAGAVLLCQPVREDAALDAELVSEAVDACQRDAGERRIGGKELTPFLLSCLAGRTEGASLRANVVLLEDNARLAGAVAAAFADLGERRA